MGADPVCKTTLLAPGTQGTCYGLLRRSGTWAWRGHSSAICPRYSDIYRLFAAPLPYTVECLRAGRGPGRYSWATGLHALPEVCMIWYSYTSDSLLPIADKAWTRHRENDRVNSRPRHRPRYLETIVCRCRWQPRDVVWAYISCLDVF